MKVLVKENQDVAQGAALLVIEAMKMQNELRAPRYGRVEEIYVYLDPSPRRAKTQLAERRRMTVGPMPVPVPGGVPPLEPIRVIDVLVAVIHAPKEEARIIAARLRAAGLVVSDEQVEVIFAQYGLEKKTARSRSTRSRR